MKNLPPRKPWYSDNPPKWLNWSITIGNAAVFLFRALKAILP